MNDYHTTDSIPIRNANHYNNRYPLDNHSKTCYDKGTVKQRKMKVESGFQEHFHHIIYNDFWYSLSEGSVSNKNDLHLKNDEDAEKVMNAIQVLKQYQKVCEKEAEMFDDAD